MDVQAPPRTGFEKWQDGMRAAATDASWNAWDCEIQRVATLYNRHLSGTAGYVALDWQMVKAMVWVETGAHHPEWKTRPMQIGNAGDPGLASFLSGKEGAI